MPWRAALARLVVGHGWQGEREFFRRDVPEVHLVIHEPGLVVAWQVLRLAVRQHETEDTATVDVRGDGAQAALTLENHIAKQGDPRKLPTFVVSTELNLEGQGPRLTQQGGELRQFSGAQGTPVQRLAGHCLAQVHHTR